MNFNTLGNLICGEETPSFLGVFDFSVAPQFLFYSYIPIVIISILIGFFIYLKDRKSLQSKLFLSVVIFFVLWVLNVLIQWVTSYHTILMFAWQLTAIFEVGLFLATIYFAYVFINKKDLPFVGKLIIWILGFITICLVPTKLNILMYDIQNCEGVVGLLWDLIYIFEPLVILVVLFMGFITFRKETDKLIKKQIIIFTSGLAFFLTTFFVSNFYGEVTGVYEFNLWGPVGMLVFFVMLGYMIVKFHTFNIKLLSAQALIFSLVFLVLGILFVRDIENVRLITAFTLVLVTVAGNFLVKSVRKEVMQREQLQTLSEQLFEANDKLKGLDKLKTEFLSLASHQLRSPLTAIKGYTSMLMAGDFGDINPKQKETVGRVFESTNHLTKVVEDLLNVSKIEQGGMQYTMVPFDFEKAAKDLATDLSVTAKNKGLKLTFETDNKSSYTVKGDMEKIRQVILNLLDNSIKYTKEGSLTVKLSKDEKKNKILWSVADTGVGIPPEIKKTLFQKFARGEGAKMNTTGSGLGLYLAKTIIEGHKGRVWAESEGASKGSVFFVELDAV